MIGSFISVSQAGATGHDKQLEVILTPMNTQDLKKGVCSLVK